MKLITVNVPEVYLQALELLVESDRYPNRSEAIRVAIRDLLKFEFYKEWNDSIGTNILQVHKSMDENEKKRSKN